MTPAAEAALLAMRVNADIALRYAHEQPRWRQDRMVADAIAKRVEELCEAAKSRFPRALRSDYPEIPWDEIAGMRDHLAHDYANIDVDILAEVLQVHLPQIRAAVDGILGPAQAAGGGSGGSPPRPFS